MAATEVVADTADTMGRWVAGDMWVAVATAVAEVDTPRRDLTALPVVLPVVLPGVLVVGTAGWSCG
jgi:hypothetical protein